MKKSQILAALALAFALGVVAPVVTVSDTYAFTVDNPETHANEAKATAQDVATVVSAIKAEYPLAERMHNLDEIVNGANKVEATDDLKTYNVTASDGTGAVAGQKVANEAAKIVKKLTAGFGYDDEATIWANAKYTDQISAAISAAKNVPDYQVVADFIAADTDAKLQAAIAAFNESFDVDFNHDSTVTMASKSSIENQIKTTVNDTHSDPAKHANHPATATYTAYKGLYSNVVSAQEALDTYTTNYGVLRNALTADGVLNEAGLVDLGANDRATNPTIAALLALANDTYTNNMSGWNGLYNQLSNAYAIPTDSFTNYSIIIALTTTLKGLANITDKNAVEIAQDLLAYTGPVEALPEKPATGDDKNLPNAGNTGVVAGADATAKATVSIMAAIASVATAAFVAIRKIAAGKKA